MTVCISASSGDGADARVDPRFGRAPYLVFADTVTGAYESQSNTAGAGGHGVGTQVAQYVAQQNADVLVTGQVGPNAFRVLQAAGIAAYQCEGMSVADAVAALGRGELKPLDAPGPSGH
jgi:predicted Fe-Mo cluster-binding NifX family protein